MTIHKRLHFQLRKATSKNKATGARER